MSRKKVFVLKQYCANKYKWSPETSLNISQEIINNGKKPYYCNTVLGFDWISTYCYNVEIQSNNIVQRLAYVECDYVQ